MLQYLINEGRRLIEWEGSVDDEGWARDDEGNEWYVGPEYAGAIFGLHDQPPERTPPSGVLPPSQRRRKFKRAKAPMLTSKEKEIAKAVQAALKKGPDKTLEQWLAAVTTWAKVKEPDEAEMMAALRKRGFKTAAMLVRGKPDLDWFKHREKLRWIGGGHIADGVIGPTQDAINRRGYATDEELAIFYKALEDGPETHWTKGLKKKLDQFTGGKSKLKVGAVKLAPPPKPKKPSVKGGNQDQIDALQTALSKRSNNFLDSILKQVKAGKTLSDKQKKVVRQNLYRLRMKDKADLFR